MYPNDPSNIQVRITRSVLSALPALCVWSEGRGMSPRLANSTVALPTAMMAGDERDLHRTSYAYSSPLGFLLSGPVQMTHDAYRRSRLAIDPACQLGLDGAREQGMLPRWKTLRRR